MTFSVAICCRKLQDRDVLSKSDPICVLFTRPLGKESYVEVSVMLNAFSFNVMINVNTINVNTIIYLSWIAKMDGFVAY